MTREDIENSVGYWQEKANLEYIRQRQEHGVNDPYMITEIDEAFDAGFDKGYQYALQHPQWVPVEEELPPPHYEGANSTDFVLAYDGYDVMFGYYDFEQKNWHGEDYKEVMFKITHWMPLPTPPQRKEANHE